MVFMFLRRRSLRPSLVDADLIERHGAALIWINEKGEVYARTEAQPDNPNTPFMQLKGSGRRFLFRFGESEKNQP